MNMDKNIEKIRATILKHLPNSRTRLFGSRLSNSNSPASDYDLLIITDIEYSPFEKACLSSLIRKELAVQEIDADVFVKTPLDIENYRDKIGSIIATAMKKGVLL